MPKNTLPKQREDTIQSLPMEDVMHNAMMPYAEYVILERALPRVEDGLKPVQRRILYTMMELGVTPDKPHRKSARIVGDTLGKYHPHGDTSVYDAMVRMAQDFNMRMPLVQGHGNFGSVDGDSAAAMRYTEARLAPLSMELLRHIEKDTVPFRFNFDDTLKEPDMLPARYPNLLVNGATGIAVGLATNIPPHNLGEVIDGVIARIKNPAITLQEMMGIITGPDFPTGGYVMNREEIYKAYETGKGRLTMRARTHIEKGSTGKNRIVITELPYQTNKASMLEKILALSEQKREMFAGIADIRDESDRTGMRAVIELKTGADAHKILQYLYKYSDLQMNYSVNIVAIAHGQPNQMGLFDILDYYIEYQKAIVTRRIRYELENARKREHILSGLMIAVRNIDRVIRIIRSSKNPSEARIRLMEEFKLSQIQAQAILDMRLARLTALEIESLEKEYAEVLKLIRELEAILASEKLLMKLIIKEHIEIKETYADGRRTVVLDEEPAIQIDVDEFKVVEECVVTLTKNGLIKRMPAKVYQKGIENGVDEDNEVLTILPTLTDKKIQIFTSLGNMFVVSVDAIPECKWKDKGTAINSMFAGIEKGEEITAIFSFTDYNSGRELLFCTKQGMVKRVSLSEFEIKKSKMQSSGLKEGDAITTVELIDDKQNVLCITKMGMSIKMLKSEIPVLGRTAKGVIGIKLEVGDEVILAAQVDKHGDVVIITDNGCTKRMKTSDFEEQRRSGKGQKAIAFMKNGANGGYLAAAFYVLREERLFVEYKSGEKEYIIISELKREDKTGRGTRMNEYIQTTVIRAVCLKEMALQQNGQQKMPI
jgi:DNA gyrase subunit A